MSNDIYFFFGVPLAVFGCVVERLPPLTNGAAFFPPNAFLLMILLSTPTRFVADARARVLDFQVRAKLAVEAVLDIRSVKLAHLVFLVARKLVEVAHRP